MHKKTSNGSAWVQVVKNTPSRFHGYGSHLQAKANTELEARLSLMVHCTKFIQFRRCAEAEKASVLQPSMALELRATTFERRILKNRTQVMGILCIRLTYSFNK